MDAQITIRRGYSEDGGFDYARMESDDLTREQLWKLGEELGYVGSLRRMGGYEIVSEYTIKTLGMTFTESALRGFIADSKRKLAEREERQRLGLVKCSCGHIIAKSAVMSSSRGSSCPDCYDRMSD